MIDQASGLRKMQDLQEIKVIAVSGGKGGVGKTNVSLNTAISLAQSGKRVLVLDADLGLANVDVMLGLRVTRNLSHVLSGECELDDIIIEGPAGIKIIPATYPYVIKVLQNSQKIKQTIPSLSQEKTIVKRVNYQHDKRKNSSDISVLLNNIDKWLNVYNNYQSKKLLSKQSQFSYQGSGTNSRAFF